MTPKEKAEELIKKFFNDSINKDYFCGILGNRECKLCAIACVEEIIKSHPIEPSEFNYDYAQMVNEAVSYWKEVKQELENL